MKQYTKIVNGLPIIKNKKQIIIHKNGMYTFNPTENMILEDGWIEYIPKLEEIIEDHSVDTYSLMQEIIFEQYNSKSDISDKEALDRSIIIYNWDHYLNKSLKAGQVVVYEDNVYRVRQNIDCVLDCPSIYTAALYERIVLTASGEINDPIPYEPPMEIFSGKYYTQNNILYKCIRNSELALSHNLDELINIYVNEVL